MNRTEFLQFVGMIILCMVSLTSLIRFNKEIVYALKTSKHILKSIFIITYKLIRNSRNSKPKCNFEPPGAFVCYVYDRHKRKIHY